MESTQWEKTAKKETRYSFKRTVLQWTEISGVWAAEALYGIAKALSDITKLKVEDISNAP